MVMQRSQRCWPASDAFQVDVFQFNRDALVEQPHGNDQPLATPPLDDDSLNASQRAAFHPHLMTWLEPGLGCERSFAVDKPLDRPQVVDKHSLVTDRNPAGHRIGGESLAPLVVIDRCEYVAWEERDIRIPNPPPGGVQPTWHERGIKGHVHRFEPAHKVFLATGERVEGQPLRTIGRSLLAERIAFASVKKPFRKAVPLLGQDGHTRSVGQDFMSS